MVVCLIRFHLNKCISNKQIIYCVCLFAFNQMVGCFSGCIRSLDPENFAVVCSCLCVSVFVCLFYVLFIDFN